MKRLILAIFTLLLASASFGQHIFFLKNGDKLRGRFDGGNSDTVYLRLLGNNLLIAREEIAAIYFDDKQAPKDLFAQPVTPLPAAQEVSQAPLPPVVSTVAPPPAPPAIEALATARIRGMANDYYNQENKTVPDNGAKVWIVDSARVPQFDITVIDTFTIGNTYREIYNQYKKTNIKVPSDIPAQLRVFKSNNERNFEQLCRRAANQLNVITNSPAVKTTAANAEGSYELAVAPGTYFVFVRSNISKGNNSLETEGKVYCTKVRVADAGEATVRNSFDIF
ncbi:MAG: hypothetical protein LBR81_05745 [Prevotellaceae bacterium]|jgi:hypothetical protein|nr:hypothetical protein [Prevotellaceae bacterium]